jgi:formate dehydrogenase major subunit
MPKLCATDSLEAFGSCRLCLVEIEGARASRPRARRRDRGHGCARRRQARAKLRRGVMELYISDHPLDCLTCPANGNCELQDMAGVRWACARCATATTARTTSQAEKDDVEPVLHVRPGEVHRLLALRARLRGDPGHVRADHRRAAASTRRSRRARRDFLDSECVSCGACVQACPTATLMEKSVIDARPAEHAVVTTCAYCGVGCSFRPR